MIKTLSIAKYEAKMSSRSWRFWLLLGLVAGISFFTRRDFLNAKTLGYFMGPGSTFQHPGFGLMLAVFLLGAFALGLDTCGRLRNNKVDKILFPLPFTSLQLIWGRFIGVFIILLPITVAGVFSLGLWQYLYGDGIVVWQPFIIAYALLVIPLLVPMTALAITLRTILKHDFAALLFGSVLLAGLFYGGQLTGTTLDVTKIIHMLRDSSPSIGVRIQWNQHLPFALNHLFLSLFILYLAPLYLRRQEMQGWGYAKRTNRIFGIGSLLRAASAFRFDKHLGWSYRFALLVLLVVCTAGILRAGYRYNDQMIQEELESNLFRKIIEEAPEFPADVTAYSFEVDPRNQDELKVKAVVTLQARVEADRLVFDLNAGYDVERVEINNQPTAFTHMLNRLEIEQSKEIKTGDSFSVVFHYGKKDPNTSRVYSALLGNWYPAPARLVIRRGEPALIKVDNDLFDVEAQLHLQEGQVAAFAGGVVQKEGNTESWKTTHPVNVVELYWGAYEELIVDSPGYRVRFYHLPGHEYQAQVFLEEVKDQKDYVLEKLGRFPFTELTMIEVPFDHDAYTVERGRWRENASLGASPTRMPGLLRIPENHLVYMHEGIWLLERFDHNPKEIPYYQLLVPTVTYLRERFYKNFIAGYFDDAFHPTGELAFWLKNYLTNYAIHLLEQNPWLRREGLNFDVGTSNSAPLRVAKERSLLDLHKDGGYPALERIRGEGAIRMIHHLLGDEKWWGMLEECFRKYSFSEISVDEFLDLAAKWHGEDLSWFKDQWLTGSVLPEYEIITAEAKVMEKADEQSNFNLSYELTVKVANRGTGKMYVPIFIETEMDYIIRSVWLDSGEEGELNLTVPNRPVFAIVDPENWVVQAPFYDAVKNKRAHSERRFYIAGDDRSQGARRNEFRRFRGRRGGFDWW